LHREKRYYGANKEEHIVMNDTDFQSPPVVPPSSPPPIQPISPEPPQEGNGLAIASMVLGIVSFVLCGPVCSVPAVILGHMSLGRIRCGVMSPDSRGFAMAGTILGWINIALVLLAMMVMIGLTLLAGNAGRVSPFVYAL
jgi:hypothetical protein